MGEARTWVMFAVVDRLVVSVLLETIFSDKLIKTIQPAGRKIAPYHSPQVPILMVHEPRSEAKKNTSVIRHFIEQDSALLKTPIKSEPKNNTVARQVFFKARCETTVLVSIQVAGLIEVIPHLNLARNHACMTATGIIDISPGRSFYITFANFGMTDVYLSKQQKVGEVANAHKNSSH